MPRTSAYIGSPLFDPPAPGCQITIRNSHRSQTLDALIDSGAGQTYIPRHLVQDLSLRMVRDVSVSGAAGNDEMEGMYLANIEFLGLRFDAFPVISLRKRPYVIIGRDILNRYKTILSGPTQTVTIKNS